MIKTVTAIVSRKRLKLPHVTGQRPHVRSIATLSFLALSVNHITLPTTKISIREHKLVIAFSRTTKTNQTTALEHPDDITVDDNARVCRTATTDGPREAKGATNMMMTLVATMMSALAVAQGRLVAATTTDAITWTEK